MLYYMLSIVLQIRMPAAEYQLVVAEAQKRGKAPSTLAREILVESLSGPGKATVGRSAAKKAVLQKERKPVIQTAPVIQDVKIDSVVVAPQQPFRVEALDRDAQRQVQVRRNAAMTPAASMSDRLRQMRGGN